MKNKKIKTKKSKIENLGIGDRFIDDRHSSLMIATDMKQVSITKKVRICVSENGISESIPYGTIVTKLPKEVQRSLAGKSTEIMHFSFSNHK